MTPSSSDVDSKVRRVPSPEGQSEHIIVWPQVDGPRLWPGEGAMWGRVCWEGQQPETLTKGKWGEGMAFEDSVQMGKFTSMSDPGLPAHRLDVRPASRGWGKARTQENRDPV